MSHVDNWEDLLDDDTSDNLNGLKEDKGKIEEQFNSNQSFTEDVFGDLLGIKKPTNNIPLSKPKKELASNEADLILFDFSTLKQCEENALKIASSIENSTCNSEAIFRFINIIIKKCFSKMNEKDIIGYIKNYEIYSLETKQLKAHTSDSKRKQLKNEKWSNSRIQDELDIYYGNDFDEESFDEEDDEEEFFI